MPTLHAQVRTDRPGRYLVQFCKHAAAMGNGGHTARMHLSRSPAQPDVTVAAEWSATAGTVTFAPWGTCTLAATPDALTLRIDAADEESLARIRDIVDRDLDRFSRRDPLTVTWQNSFSFSSRPAAPRAGSRLSPAVAAAASPDRAAPPEHRDAPTRGRRRQTLLLAAAAILAVVLHLGLAGTVLARSRWTGVAGDVLAALVVLKLAAIAWTRHTIRRRRSTAATGRTSPPA